jgi:hypothetical protein
MIPSARLTDDMDLPITLGKAEGYSTGEEGVE